MILLIDNYDSFTFNLLQYIGEVSESKREIRVIRNDVVAIEEIEELAPSHIVLSPGPCSPNEAGICIELVRRLSPKFPILGVCLGHQAIAQAFGAAIVRTSEIFHGKTSRIEHDDKGIFENIPQHFTATRYHSLTVAESSLPEELEVSAWCPGRDEHSKEIMAIRHVSLPHVVGVQFHPESILTSCGKLLLKAFISKKMEEFNCG